MDDSAYQELAGGAFLLAGVTIVLGFTTAAALYPGYSVANDTISALGASDAPQASQWVFNGAMVLTGVIALSGSYGLSRAGSDRAVAGVLAVTAVGGYIGVGVFPTQTGVLHLVAALIAFGGTGVAAVLSATVVAGPFRVISIVLGVGELVALGLFVVLGSGNPLGVGGLERWVAYLGVVWALAFGGYLLGEVASEPSWSGLR